MTSLPARLQQHEVLLVSRELFLSPHLLQVLTQMLWLRMMKKMMTS